MNENENSDVLSGTSSVETETDTAVVSVVGVEDLQQLTSDLAHVNLFGSFMVCGTLVGIFLFRRFAR